MNTHTHIKQLIPAFLILCLLALTPCARAAAQAAAPGDTAGATATLSIPPRTATPPGDVEKPAPAEPATEPLAEDLVLKNEFIKIIVNRNKSDMGRFSLNTVKGDPKRPGDDNQMLNYGRVRPWTSFTTVRVDGISYVFGGETNRRAGKTGHFGTVIEQPHIEGESVVTKIAMGGVHVTQTLSFAGGPISSLYDTMRITYTLENTDNFAHTVGLRVVLDTLLGSNDGAPFRVLDKRITREQRFTGDEVPAYWIAFDSLDDPRVISRGTLLGEGLTPPDTLMFSNWGKLADHPWNAPYARMQSFIREGEGELDSAMAMTWNEEKIEPGALRSYATQYGIEYLNISGDALSIGTLPHLGKWPTAPNQIKTYTLYAYVANTLEIPMQNVEIKLQLPEGVELADGGDGVRRFKELAPKQEETVGWRVRPKAFSGNDEDVAIVIAGSSKQVSKTSVSTKATLLAAPEVELTVTAPEALRLVDRKRLEPQPFPIEVRARNKGLSSIDNLVLQLDLPPGLEFPAAQKTSKKFPRLEGRDEVVFLWKVIANGSAAGDLTYTISATSESTEDKKQSWIIAVPELPIKIEWMGVPDQTKPGVFLPAEVFASNLRGLNTASFTVTYDPSVVDVVRVSQGTVFVEGLQAAPWPEPVIDNRNGIVSGILGTRQGNGFSGNGSLAVIHFRTRAPGDANIRVNELKLTDTAGRAMEKLIEDSNLKIVE
jgi:hypothetical protein